MTGPDPQALPGTWARLHPLSPLARGARAVVVLGAVTVPQQLGQQNDPFRLWVDLAVALLIIAAGVVSWAVTRWRVAGSELQIETGLLRRQSIRVPLARVQAVDLVRPLAARVLGLAEVRLVLAGSGPGKSRLSYLPERRATQVRAQLIALSHGLSGDTPEAAERPILGVPNGRLLASALLGAPLLVTLLLVVALVFLAVSAPQAVGPVLGGTATVIFASLSQVVRRLNTEFSFAVGEAPDGLRLTSGLLQTRAETIPHGRVQAVRVVQPLLWRPAGWCRVEIDVAQQREHEIGQDDVRQLTRALLPVGTRADAEWMLSRVLPGAGTSPPVGSRPPPRARWKAPLSYGRLRAWHDSSFVATSTGRLRTETMLIPLEKVQSIRLTQGPVQRRLAVATVHVDVAGRRWRGQARDRDAAEAQQLVGTLATAARHARDRTSVARQGVADSPVQPR
ncbi:MAG: PH domain-containing protein [Actinomycetota bacterium]|nr:PH domain-containing protein [Actinomycetota bacterium]